MTKIEVKSETKIMRINDLPNTILDAKYSLKFKGMGGEIFNGPFKF